LAATYARKGEIEKAREWFAKLPPKFDPAGIADTPRDLYEEAAALLREKTPSAETKEDRPNPGAAPK
jgi:hypothetical protein